MIQPTPAQPNTAPRPGEETLTGVLERIIYQNEENQYCVGEFRREGRRNVCVIAGVLPSVQCGETLRATGQWTRHPQYGDQFKVRAFESILPASIHGIRKYLGSGLVPGIGKKYADRIVDKFGADTLRIISEESGRLTEVEGVGKKRAKAIRSSWEQQKAVRDVMVFMQTYGVSVAQCLRLVKQYGTPAATILKNDPYRVAREVRGIGFQTADKIARNLGYYNESERRVDAGLLHALQQMEDQGHTAIPEEELARYAAELLEIGQRLAEERLDALKEARDISAVAGGMAQLPGTRVSEERLAQSLAHLLRQPGALPPIKIEKALEWAQQRVGFGFAPEQADAVRMALSRKVAVVTGGPGTGKTTLLRAVVAILKAKQVRIVLASPTGRAAQRMAESAGHYAQTIHRLLDFDPAAGRFTRCEESPLKADYVIVDEASMLDTRLASALVRALPSRCCLLLVGDIHQLPSVGPGNVLRDLIDCDDIAVCRLDRVFRQEEQSGIVSTAHDILRGVASLPCGVAESVAEIDPAQDVQFLRAAQPEACAEKVVELVGRQLPRWHGFDPVRDIQVLAPMHRGVVGVSNLNAQLQGALNPQGPRLSVGGAGFRAGDKIMQGRNNYERGVFNGDLGIVTSINGTDGTLSARFHEEEVDFDRLEVADLSLAYAITVHKSQGSEFSAVVLPMLKQQFVMLQRNLLYTGLTRGRSKVILVGDPDAYAMAVGNARANVRHTGLPAKLEEALRR